MIPSRSTKPQAEIKNPGKGNYVGKYEKSSNRFK